MHQPPYRQKPMTEHAWLIVANGDPLPASLLLRLARGKSIIALDSAYHHLQKCAITPHVLLGDFDSIEPSLLASAKADPQLLVQHTPDQNKTDLDKGILHALDHNAQSITICSAIGNRLDHSLFNIRLLKRYHHHPCAFTLYSSHERIVYLEDESITLSGCIGQQIGILGAPEGILTSSGLKYDATQLPLRFADSSAICNHFAADRVTLEVQGGVLCIVGLV